MIRFVFHAVALSLGMVMMAFLIIADPMMIKYPTKIGLVGFIAVTYIGGDLLLSVGHRWLARAYGAAKGWLGKAIRAAICFAVGHDLEPEVTTLTVVELPKQPYQGPPHSAYRQSADDMGPSLGLVMRRRRPCRRCRNECATGTDKP